MHQEVGLLAALLFATLILELLHNKLLVIVKKRRKMERMVRWMGGRKKGNEGRGARTFSFL